MLQCLMNVFYSSNIFQINSQVPMIYCEHCYSKKNLILSTSNEITIFKHEKLNTCYTLLVTLVNVTTIFY
jgi:hypothetical protein